MELPRFVRLMSELEFVRVAKCCDVMAKAQEAGTDNEAHGAAVHVSFVGGDAHIGSLYDAAVKFCPWCGKAVVMEPTG